MWIPIMLLVLLLVFLLNPLLSLLISIFIFVSFMAYRLARRGKLGFAWFGKAKSSKYFREFVFRSLDLDDFREVNLTFKFKVSDKLLLVSSYMGFNHVYGALLIHNIRDSAMLRSILLSIPFRYNLIFRGGGGSAESYILLLHVRVGFHGLDSAVSRIVELLNSLSLSIPAESVVVLSGDEIISQVLPIVQEVA
jgi:hypothetical protein